MAFESSDEEFVPTEATSLWKSSRQKKPPSRYEESVSEESTSDDSDLEYDEENNNCGVCKRKKAPQKKDGRKRDVWVSCDVCDHWFHDVCVGASEDDLDKEQFMS